MSGSSPLWIAGLAGMFAASGQLTLAAPTVLAILALLALFFVAEGYLAAQCGRTPWTVGGGFVVALLALPSAGGLMETPLAVALLTGGLWALTAGRLVLAGALLGMAGATRFEMLVPALLCVTLTGDWRRRVWLLAGAAPVWAIQFSLLQWFYGSSIPHTMSAKAIVYQPERADLLRAVPQELGPYLGSLLLVLLGLAAIAEVLALLRRGVSSLGTDDVARLILGSFPVLLAVIYLATVPLVFPWYWTLSVCPAAILIWRQRTNRESEAGVLMATRHIGFASILLLAIGSAVSVHAAVTGQLTRSPWLVENARTRTYQHIGRLLQAACPDGVVAAAEIGALGWTFPGRILDGVGLASPEVLKYHPLSVPSQRASGLVGAIPAAAIEALRPDVIVAMEVFAQDLVTQRNRVPPLAEYTTWWTEPVFSADLPSGLPADLWWSRSVIVFSRPGAVSRCSD